MGERARLANRRLQITTTIEFAGREWLVSVGFDRDGKVREVFDKGHKAGQALEFLLQDACVLASICLQSGHDVADLAAMCGRQGVEADSPPASEIGAILRKAAEIEARSYGGIREAYQASAGRQETDHQP